MFAGGHAQGACPLAIAWVSYHALALFDGFLPVQTVKDRLGDVAPKQSLGAGGRSLERRYQPDIRPVSRSGADGDRTHDLRLAKPALSQLSYSPTGPRWNPAFRRFLVEVGPGRVELPTLPLSGVRSSRLSYGPVAGWISPAPPVSQN